MGEEILELDKIDFKSWFFPQCVTGKGKVLNNSHCHCLIDHLLYSRCYPSEWVSEVAQSCPTLWDPVDLPGSSVHGILQARILEWVAISFSKGSSQPRDRTQVSHTAGRRFNLWATREALIYI